jgi:hypothetical protein
MAQGHISLSVLKNQTSVKQITVSSALFLG